MKVKGMKIQCPDCGIVNPVKKEIPLRKQYCKKCRCALRLDHPEEVGLVNKEPY